MAMNPSVSGIFTPTSFPIELQMTNPKGMSSVK